MAGYAVVDADDDVCFSLPFLTLRGQMLIPVMYVHVCSLEEMSHEPGNQ